MSVIFIIEEKQPDGGWSPLNGAMKLRRDIAERSLKALTIDPCFKEENLRVATYVREDGSTEGLGTDE